MVTICPVAYEPRQSSGHIDALLDFFGGGYVAMAVEELRLPPDRGETIADSMP